MKSDRNRRDLQVIFGRRSYDSKLWFYHGSGIQAFITCDPIESDQSTLKTYIASKQCGLERNVYNIFVCLYYEKVRSFNIHLYYCGGIQTLFGRMKASIGIKRNVKIIPF